LKKDRVADMTDKLINQDIGGLPIIDEEGHVWAIVPERDVMVFLSGNQTKRRISELMSKRVGTLRPDTTIKQACAQIMRRGFGRLPFVENGKLVGIVTARDFVRYVASKQFFKHL